MIDRSERLRRARLAEIDAQPASREGLEERHGQVWDTRQLAQAFVVVGIALPCVVVRRKADGVVGSLLLQQRPRFYYSFRPDERALPGHGAGACDGGHGAAGEA